MLDYFHEFLPQCDNRLPGWRRNRHRRLALEVLERRELLTAYFVSTTGDDGDSGLSIADPFRTIQHALDVATEPGDLISVREGTYFEKVEFTSGGTAEGGHITLQAFDDELPILDGTGVAGDHMVLIEDLSYVKLIGFEIVNNLGVLDGSGVRFVGAGSHIEIRDNIIHEMRGENAMGVTVYGTSTKSAVSNIIIDGNEIYDAEPAPSEALVLNGNVTDFEVTNNVVHDVNNIGIDLIGGERDINRKKKLVTRNGVVRGNTVYHARSTYEDGFAAGIYVDGGRDIIIENNESYGNDLGIEIGAENRGVHASGIVVRNNIVHHNDKTGIVFGGYSRRVGRVKNSHFVNNTVYKNDTLDEGFGQLWIQWATKNVVANNIFVASDNNVMLYSEKGNRRNSLDHNLWYATAGADNVKFTWRGKTYNSFAQYQQKSKQDRNSIFADPVLIDPAAGDFHLSSISPAIDAGTDDDGHYAPTDFENNVRPHGLRPDIGAFEFTVPSALSTIERDFESHRKSQPFSPVSLNDELIQSLNLDGDCNLLDLWR